MGERLFSLLDPPPPGFVRCSSFSRRDFREAPFALLAPGFAEAEVFLRDAARKLTGIIVVPGGEEVNWKQERTLLFRMTVPHKHLDLLASVISPMLRMLLMLQASLDQQALFSLELERATDTKNRLSSEFELIRRGLVNEIEERRAAERHLRESEERFREIFDLSPDGILLADIETRRFYSANRTMCSMLGCASEEIRGMGVFDIHPEEDLPHVIDRFERQLRGEISLATDIPVKRKNGTVFYADVNSVLLSISGRNYICGLFRDITGRKLEEEEKERLQEQLGQLRKMESVGRLAGGVAHDFNNMLGVILGYAELILRQMGPGDPNRWRIEEIRNASQRSADLTRQLLAFARRQTISPKVLDLNATVSGMLNMLKRLIGEDIDLAWKPSPRACLTKIDPVQIDQVLANLCVNARDAISDVGKVIIETGNAEIDRTYCESNADCVAGDYVVLAVSDNGCGMEKNVRDHIFEPFYTTKEIGKGTGLGMATVYGIVRQNNGIINVYSEPGIGTTFRIYLPAYIEKHAGAAESGMAGAVSGGKETVLLVEDEPMLLELGRNMLEILGYNVLKAGTPGEAIRLAGESAGDIDLLLTDVVMPEMNGRDLAGRLQTLYPGMKCLFTSGYTANVIAHHGVLEEGVHFLQKPFTPQELALKLREALG